MSRTGWINRVTALLMASVWLVAFFWTLHLEASDRLAYPVHVFVSAPGATEHPWVTWVWPEFAERPGGVRVGDPLLSVGGRDMTGAGRFETIVAVLARTGASTREPAASAPSWRCCCR